MLECPLGKSQGLTFFLFLFFGMRTAFGLDACLIFP